MSMVSSYFLPHLYVMQRGAGYLIEPRRQPCLVATSRHVNQFTIGALRHLACFRTADYFEHAFLGLPQANRQPQFQHRGRR
jgi:hypothetical protein